VNYFVIRRDFCTTTSMSPKLSLVPKVPRLAIYGTCADFQG
jgi:hypothetical protein